MRELLVYLEWQNLVFLIPLVTGLLLVLGSALGVIDPAGGPHGYGHLDGDGEAHLGAHAGGTESHAADHAAAHASDGSSRDGVLSLLGLGRLPLVLLATIASVIFGGTGMIFNTLLGSLLQTSGIFGLLSLAGALIATLLLTGIVGRVVTRVMPTIETNAASKEDLVGCTGTVLLECDHRSGLAQVTRQGDLYQIKCRASPEFKYGKGTPILVTEFHQPTQTYLVCRDPTSDE